MKHFHRSIEGWFSFPRLYRRAVRTVPDGGTLVEIGSWKGKSLVFLTVESINSGKRQRIVSIDPWIEEAQPQGTDERPEDAYEIYLRNIAPISERIEVMRATSLEANGNFADGSVDFVFIDGSHAYEDVLADCRAWYPKVRPGGMIAGHDYHWKPVKRAVDEFAAESGFGTPKATELCWVLQVPPDGRSRSEKIAATLGRPVQWGILRVAALRRTLLGRKDP